MKPESEGGSDAGSERAAPIEHRRAINGIEQCWFEWGAGHRGVAPTILLVHATGFHARIWDQVVARLGARHVVSVDQRGHGRSGGGPIEHWAQVGADLLELVRILELDSIIGVGHSMGGHAMVEVAARYPEPFERLVLIDPVIADPASYGEWPSHLPAGETHPTSRRRRRFDSPQAMFERFADRHPYSLFLPEVLMDYCVYGLLPAAEGEGFELACAPDVEASVYMTSRTNAEIHEHVGKVSAPVLLLRAPPGERKGVMDFAASPTWPELVRQFPNAHERVLTDLTHFIPMQAPSLVAEAILDGAIRP